VGTSISDTRGINKRYAVSQRMVVKNGLLRLSYCVGPRCGVTPTSRTASRWITEVGIITPEGPPRNHPSSDSNCTFLFLSVLYIVIENVVYNSHQV
jgi:hypothetical protein